MAAVLNTFYGNGYQLTNEDHLQQYSFLLVKFTYIGTEYVTYYTAVFFACTIPNYKHVYNIITSKILIVN